MHFAFCFPHDLFSTNTNFCRLDFKIIFIIACRLRGLFKTNVGIDTFVLLDSSNTCGFTMSSTTELA